MEAERYTLIRSSNIQYFLVFQLLGAFIPLKCALEESQIQEKRCKPKWFCLIGCSPFEAEAKGRQAKWRERGFRTSQYEHYLQIGLGKRKIPCNITWPAKKKKKLKRGPAQQQHLHKPPYSHLFTEVSAMMQCPRWPK